jgi:ankyrin repeat protein
MSGNLEIVDLVLAAGASVDCFCEGGSPAWVYAIGTNQQNRIIQRLLKAGAPVNSEVKEVRKIPALRAVAVDDPELMRILLEAGLDLEVPVRGVALREIALQIAAPRVREVIENWKRMEG